MHSAPLGAVVFVVLVALSFDFFNGFHDAANSIATVVSTRVLTPRVAVVWAAFWNFAALFLGTKVAASIAKDVVDQNVITIGVIFSAMVGAILWDLITWYFGLPTSSSHALVGGVTGAAVAQAGWHSLIGAGIRKILVFIVLSPVLGLLLGFTIMTAMYWAFHRYRKVEKLNRGFRRTQLLSAAAYGLGHAAAVGSPMGRGRPRRVGVDPHDPRRLLHVVGRGTDREGPAMRTLRTGRRPLFFAVVAILCLVLIPATPAEFRWVNYFSTGLALFWAVV